MKLLSEIRSHPLASTLSLLAIALAVGPGIYARIAYGEWGSYQPQTSVLTATLVAILWYTAYTREGLGEWRDQLRTQASFKAAKALRVATERVSRDLRNFQSPAIPQREDPRRDGQLPAPESRLAEFIVDDYRERSDRLRGSVEELEVAVVEAAAVWDEQELLTERFRNVEDQLQRLQGDLTYHVHSLSTPDFRADVPEQDDSWAEAVAALWGEDEEADAAGQQLRQELAAFRDTADERLSL